MAPPSGFKYRATDGETVIIYHHDRLASTLTGRAGVDFLQRVERADEQAAQLLMAKATGNYKRGNERH